MMKSTPPERAVRFLRWYCKDEYLEEIEGNLIEIFHQECEENQTHAQRAFWWNVLRHLRPDYIKSFNREFSILEMGKLNNYVKIGWRNLKKNKTYSGIKIGSLAIGIASCLLIALYVNQELSYDNFYDNNESIYRVTYYSNSGGYESKAAHFPSPFSEVLVNEFNEIEQSGRLNTARNFGAGSNQVRRADRMESIYEDLVALADQATLNILEIPFLMGNAEEALEQPGSLVITQRISEKYFPDENPIGKTLIFNNDEEQSYLITGVIEDFEDNTHFNYDFIKSLAGREFFEGESTSWRNHNYITYVLLGDGVQREQLESKLPLVLDKYFLPAHSESDDTDWVKSFEFHLQPVDDIYLNRNQIQDGLTHGDIRYIWLFGSIGFFILTIAGINFVNLSIAKSSQRAKEIGLRKTMGSSRGESVQQFLVESILLSVLALMLSLLVLINVIPFINEGLDLSIRIPWENAWFIPTLLLGSFVIGLLAGLYPATVMSAFIPIKAIKNLKTNYRNTRLRSSLVVFQFSITCILIVGTIIVNQQMGYLLNRDIGFDKDRIMLLEGTHTLSDKLPLLKQELSELPSVEQVSVTGFIPVDGFNKNNGNWITQNERAPLNVSGQQWAVDYDYIDTYGLSLKEGRNFMMELASDSQAVIINQLLADQLLLNNPIGAQISNHMGTWTVIGVVENFNYENMRDEIRPLGMYVRRSVRAVSVKLRDGQIAKGVEEVVGTWKNLSPDQEIVYSFLDSRFKNMYREVSHMNILFTLFSSFAIIIASLGLFALSSYSIEQRKKEISVRLVLGATFGSIIQLLTEYYLKLVLAALVISIPISWYLMQDWLDEFAYRISFHWKVFVIAACVSILITIITTAYQAIKATVINPVENLKEG